MRAPNNKFNLNPVDSLTAKFLVRYSTCPNTISSYKVHKNIKTVKKVLISVLTIFSNTAAKQTILICKQFFRHNKGALSARKFLLYNLAFHESKISNQQWLAATPQNQCEACNI